MKRTVLSALAALTFLWSAFLPLPAFASPGVTEAVREELRRRIEMAESPPSILVEKEAILASEALPGFYQKRIYAPAWTGEDGTLPLVESLARALDGATSHGLSPEDYHASHIRRLLASIRETREKNEQADPGVLADLDLLCTDGFLVFAAHMVSGKVSPESIEVSWLAARREADLEAVLTKALGNGEVEAALENLAPPYPCYQGLRTAYESLLPEMGKPVLPKVTGVSMLRPGSRGPAVGRLQVRLAALGYLPENQPEDAPFFGPRTEEAVRRFQEDHRLSADGLAGPTTLETINADPADRARTIAVNLERWRWLPHDLGRRYILVNTADFSLKVVEDGKTVLAMRAIVGKPYRRTPVFSARMTYMVLAPYWNVPPKIAIHDKLPLIRKDPAWLSENHMRVFSGWGAESREVDPAEVNWKALPVGRFPYHLRQDPGPGNALGTMKFMFPNKYNVYIHDTPAHELFDKAQRAFSSGCIRIQEPMKLALYLQRTDPRWNEESLGKVIEAGVETTVSLPEPLPVHVLYWTAWVDEAGELVFRPDLYGRDEVLAQALFTPHPNIQEAP